MRERNAFVARQQFAARGDKAVRAQVWKTITEDKFDDQEAPEARLASNDGRCGVLSRAAPKS